MRPCSRLLCITIWVIAAAGSAHAGPADRLQPSVGQASADLGSIPVKAKSKRAQALPGDASESTWEIFGFTDGSDTGPAGSRGLYHESVLRTGHDVGALATSTGVVYSPTNATAAWLGLDTSWEQIDSAAGQSVSRGLGPSGGIKYQLLNRERSPVGLAAQWSFSWQAAKSGGQPYDIVAQELRLLADWQFARDWFAAANLAYAPEFDVYAAGQTERTHTVEASAAVTRRIVERYFFGGELRQLSRYQSAFSGLQEQTLYIGPTVLARFDTGYVGLAWSMRVAQGGSEASSFGAQQFRLKAGLVF